MTTKRWIQVGVAVTIVTVAVLLFLDLGEMGHLLKTISLPLFLATLAVSAADQTLMGLKWNLLLKTFAVHVPARVPVAAYWRGRFLRLIAPSILGLDAYRAYYLKKHGGPDGPGKHGLVPILSSIFVERFLGLFSSLAVIALLFPLALDGMGLPAPGWLWPIAGAGFLGVWGLVWLSMRYSHLPGKRERVPLAPQKLQQPLLAFLKALSRVKDDRGRVYLYFAISNVEKLAYGSCLWFAAKSIGIDNVTWLYCIAAIPVIALLERLPISVSAIGVREGLYVALLTPFGVEASAAVTVGLVVRAAEIILILFSLLSWIPGLKGASLKSRLDEIAHETA